ncbi:MAG: glycoside hydrolase family 16 protein [Chitinophagaceae bacterium]|nr:glycoside hydrolase family 16 protein [Chitinophagaceae bacterium]
MRRKFLFTIFFLLQVCFLFSQSKKLVWADEFNTNGSPDSTKWSYDYGGSGWGNNELQFYTAKRKENAWVKNGHLIIEARKEDFKNKKYTSARMVSKNKGDWKYGRFEIKARLPKGKGIWPAIWMLPTKSVYGGWPKSGEIDIMEFVGYMPDSVFGSIHTGLFNHSIGTQKTKGLAFKDLATAFHVYAIEWMEGKISFFVDGEKYLQFDNNKSGSGAWPFDQEFHIILNIAVGGNWGGKQGVDDSIFPQTMEIDYVRVYR